MKKVQIFSFFIIVGFLPVTNYGMHSTTVRPLVRSFATKAVGTGIASTGNVENRPVEASGPSAHSQAIVDNNFVPKGYIETYTLPGLTGSSANSVINKDLQNQVKVSLSSLSQPVQNSNINVALNQQSRQVQPNIPTSGTEILFGSKSLPESTQSNAQPLHLNQFGLFMPLSGARTGFGRGFTIAESQKQETFKQEGNAHTSVDNNQVITLNQSPLYRSLSSSAIKLPANITAVSLVENSSMAPNWLLQEMRSQTNQKISPAVPIENRLEISFQQSALKSKQPSVLQENLATQTQTPQKIAFADGSSLLAVGLGKGEQPTFAVVDSHNQFGIESDGKLMIFVYQDGQQLVQIKINPAIFFNQANMGNVQSFVETLPIHIKTALPKFLAQQSVQQLLEMATQPSNQLVLNAEHTNYSALSQNRLLLETENLNRTGSSNLPIERLDRDMNVSQPVLTSSMNRQRLQQPQPAVKTSIKEVKLVDNFEKNQVEDFDIFAEVDNVQEKQLERPLSENKQNIVEITTPAGKELLDPLVERSIKSKTLDVALAEFNQLPSNKSSRLAKIVAMLKRLQEMIINFFESFAYAPTYRQRQEMERAQRRAAAQLSSGSMSSSGWIDSIKNFINEVWDIMTTKSAHDNVTIEHD